jgi:hypothetical protein
MLPSLSRRDAGLKMLCVMTGNLLGEANFVFWCDLGNYFAQSCDKKAIGESWLFCSFLGIIVNS